MAAKEKGEQQEESSQSIQRLHRVESLDWQHQRAEQTVTPVADHAAIPVLRLQKAGEPAPPLTQKTGQCAWRIGARLGAADHAHIPVQTAIEGVAAQPVNQLIVLDQAIRIDAAD